MKLRHGVVPLLAALLALLPSPSVAQVPAQAAPAVPAVKAGQVAEKPAQTEADKKYAEVMKIVRDEDDTAKPIEALERFIRENPGFPKLESVYSTLLSLSAGPESDGKKVLALADDALQRFPAPGSMVRPSAVRAKFQALKKLEQKDAIADFAAKLLETEAAPQVLQAAAQADDATAVKLLEKAITERKKIDNQTTYPTLDTLRWDYAQALNRGGRKEEALQTMRDVVGETVKAVTDLEALPPEDPKRRSLSRLKMNLGSRCQALANTMSAAGNYDQALEYVALAEKQAENPLENTSRIASVRAGIYEKMGKPDLVLQSRAQAFAARMDKPNRDQLLKAAEQNGITPAEAYERARKIRKTQALAIKGFELKTLEGNRATLESFRSKVTLVTFFFPT